MALDITETLQGIAKAVLPRWMEERLGLSSPDETMTFKVGEGLSPELGQLAEKKITQLAQREFEVIGLPFTTKEWLIPKEGPEKFMKEWVVGEHLLKPYSQKLVEKSRRLRATAVDQERADQIVIKRELENRGSIKYDPNWLDTELNKEQQSALRRYELVENVWSGLETLGILPAARIIKVRKPATKIVKESAEAVLSKLPKAPTPPDQVIKAFDEVKIAVAKAVDFSGDRLLELAKEHKRVNTLVAEIFRQGIVNVDQVSYFKNWSFTTDEAAEFIERFATFGGQDLNRISQWQKRLSEVLPSKVLQQLGKEPAGFVGTLWHKVPSTIINAWRASLVGQLATAMRNASVSLSVFSFRIIEDALIGATKTITGKAPLKRAFAPMIADTMAIFNRLSPAKRMELAQLLEANPLAQHKLYATPINDVVLVDRYAKAVTIFNRTQEFAVRNLVFDAVLRGELGKLGLDISKLSPTEVPVKAILKAVNEALRVTVAAPPKGFFKEMTRLWNQTPTNILAVLTYPFPRYLSNAVRMVYEFSPMGVTKFLNPKVTKALLQGDEEAMRIAARVFVGTNLQMAAIYIRNSEIAGERWYEIKIGNRTTDTRPFGPLLPTYLFIAEAMKDPEKLGVREYTEGLLGMRRLAGTSLFMVSLLEGSESWENLKTSITRISGDFLKGFLNPLKTFKDFVAQFSEEEAIVRYSKSQPLQAFLEQIPGVSQILPEYPSITRSEPLRTEEPALRQLTGVALQREKNFLETEMDRLGIKFFQVWPKTGHPEVNRLIAEKTGYLMEEASKVLESSKKYERMNDSQKELTIRELFSEAKSEAKSFILEEQKEMLAKEFNDEAESIEDPVERKKYLLKLKQKGLLPETIIQEMLKLRE